MAGQIFYSQVNENLQSELLARARAGKTNRDTKSMNFMLGKIANVTLIAYKNQKHAIDNPDTYLGKLGGSDMTTSNYLPGRYLNPEFKYTRTIPNGYGEVNITDKKIVPRYNEFTMLPYITAVDVSLNDTSTGAGITNTATVNIVIPNPIQDLDYIESTFMRPGRAITLSIEYPDSAVITKKELSDNALQFKTATPKSKAQTNLKMNVAMYDMLITSFSMSYNQNGSISVTLNLRGISGVYTDVTSIITKEAETSDKVLTPIYQSIHTDIQNLYTKVQGQDKTKTEIGSVPTSDYAKAINNYNDKWWMVTLNNSTQYTYCTMGYLIDYINNNILNTKQQSITPDAIIVFNPEITNTKLINDVISGYPQEIILDIKDTYDSKTWITEPLTQLESTRFRNFVIPGKLAPQLPVGYPSMIWISTKILQDIETSVGSDKNKLTVKYVIQSICEKIKNISGNMINLQLVPNPSNLNELLLFDMNNINLAGIKPFSVPMTNLSEDGTIVKDFQVEAKLPASAQSLMYTINNSDVISEKEVAPYINYMYNNFSVTRTIDTLSITDSYGSDTAEQELKKLKDDYTVSYNKYKTELETAVKEFISAPFDEAKRSTLLTALKKRVQYPTDTFELSNRLSSPKYPHEISFTIDGINGLKYGDALEFNFLPNRYKQKTTFSIIAITHTVNESGIWQTQVRCLMRPDFNK